jgi:zinc transporter
MTAEDGLIFAYALDGQGGGREIGWPEISVWAAAGGLLWLHLDRTGPASQRWWREAAGLDPVIAEGLLALDVRPREVPVDEALLVTLRGVNLNPGAPSRGYGRGPDLAGARMAPVIDQLVDRIDDLEETVLRRHSAGLRVGIAGLRREAIGLRRCLASQREVMARLTTSDAPWLGAADRAVLREVADRTTRFVEDLDAARERAAVVQDELNTRLSDQANRTMYLLTVVATVLLPPSPITGLLGVNLGGVPGAEQPWAFWILVVLLLPVAWVEILVLRRLKWI